MVTRDGDGRVSVAAMSSILRAGWCTSSKVAYTEVMLLLNEGD